MFDIILKIIISALAVTLSAYILPGVEVDNYLTALTVAVVLGFFNAFLKPIMIVLTIPVTVLTLGLFLLIINASMILLTDYFVVGFRVNNFFTAILFSIILSVINSIFEGIRKRDDRETEQ